MFISALVLFDFYCLFVCYLLPVYDEKSFSARRIQWIWRSPHRSATAANPPKTHSRTVALSNIQQLRRAVVDSGEVQHNAVTLAKISLCRCFAYDKPVPSVELPSSSRKKILSVYYNRNIRATWNIVNLSPSRGDSIKYKNIRKNNCKIKLAKMCRASLRTRRRFSVNSDGSLPCERWAFSWRRSESYPIKLEFDYNEWQDNSWSSL